MKECDFCFAAFVAENESDIPRSRTARLDEQVGTFYLPEGAAS